MSGLVAEHSYAKGPVLHYLDEMSRRPDARPMLEQLQRAIADKSGDNFPDLHETFDRHLFSPLNVGSTTIAGISSYLQKHWIDENSPDTHFPGLQPIAPIVGHGLLKTIELSLAGQPNPKPIDSWWIVDHPDFRLINLVSPQQVTLLIKTPRPKSPYPADIWGQAAEAYTTGRHVVTRKFESRSR